MRLIIIEVLLQSLYIKLSYSLWTYIKANVDRFLVLVILEGNFRRIKAPEWWIRDLKNGAL